MEGTTKKEGDCIGRLSVMICNDLSTGIDIKEKVIGGSILGSDTFINWVRDKYLPAKSREIPAVQRLKKYTAKEEIIDALCKKTNKSFDEIKKERGIIRQIAMDLLYRVGELISRKSAH